MIRKLKAFGIDWKVRCLKDHPLLTGNMAYCDMPTNTILISSLIPHNEQMSALLHEIVHIVDHRLSLEIDEDKTMRLEAGLFSILHDNHLQF